MSLAHIFKSVEDDWTSSLPIVGTFCDNKCTSSSKLPEWLNGSLICIGPGKWDFPKGNFTCNHYCDGFGVLLKFTFKISLDKSRACTFERQLVQSDAYKKACIAQKPVLAEFGTKSSKDPTKNFLSRMVTFLPESSDNSNACIFKFGNQLFISNAACFFHEINPSTLEIVEKFDSKKLFGTATFCGKPILDKNYPSSSDGENPPYYYYNVGLSITATGSKYLVVRFPSSSSSPDMKESFKKYEIVASIPSSKSMYLSYLPCFGLTENYIIIIEQPYSMNVKSFMSFALKGTYFSIMDCFQYIPGEEFKNKFLIINKKTGEVVVKNIEASEPFFYVNIINTFEVPENNEIIIDLFTYPNSNVLDSMTLHKKRNGIRLPQEEYPTGKRFVIPLKKHSDESTPLMIMSQNITKPGLEYPIVNEKVRGRPYKWFYGTGEFFLGTFQNSLVKMNRENPEDFLMWKDEEYFIPNQPTFISNPTSCSSEKEGEEDDGILISLVLDARVNEKIFLVILNARDMKEITRIYFDCLMPPPLQTVFIPKDEKL